MSKHCQVYCRCHASLQCFSAHAFLQLVHDAKAFVLDVVVVGAAVGAVADVADVAVATYLRLLPFPPPSSLFLHLPSYFHYLRAFAASLSYRPLSYLRYPLCLLV